VLVRLTLFLTTLCSTLAFASERIIFAFPTNGSGGSVPAGGLISDAAGNLYGVTAAGGAYKWGGIFRLALENGAWTEALLYSFKGGAADGSQPESALLLDTSGNLYGTTSGGGPSNDGTVFKLAPDGQGGWTETILHAFSGKDGRWPITAPLVADAKGNLYGVTEGACYYGCVNGTLFELSPQQNGSWSFRVLHRFVQSAIPLSGVILDKAGNLYGTTQYDGAINCIAGSGCGTVYKLARVGTSWKFSSIHVFHYGDGAYPEANLVMDSAGNLYGTTNGGGGTYNGGVAFKLSPTKTGWTETVLYVFGAPGDGSHPSSLVFDTHGNLFGSVPSSTDANDQFQNGYVFRLSRQSNGNWSESVVYAFPNTNAAPFPNSNLIWNTSRTALMGTIGPYSDPAGAVYKVTP
jgi:uncharacterized repeat protein (TIGR03803 family)